MALESDCLLMIKECLSNENTFSKLDSLMVEIKKLQACFVDCLLQGVYREHNQPAHPFARYAWNLDRVVMWDS